MWNVIRMLGGPCAEAGHRMDALRTRATLALALMVAASIASAEGCSSKSTSGTSKDAGHDTSTGEGGVTLCQGAAPVLMWADPSGTLQPPDWSCYEDGGTWASPPTPFVTDAGDDGGTDATPDAPADETSTPEAGMPEASAQQDIFQLTDFTTHAPAPGATVDIFFGNTLAGGASPDVTGVTSTTDAGPGGLGAFLFAPPPAPVFGYRVHSQTTTPALQEVIQLDNLTPAPGTLFPGNSITTSEYETLIAGVLGTAHTAPGTAVIVAGARDCASHELLGGVLSLIDDATGQPVPTGTGATDVQESYFGTDNFPHPECTHTVSSPIALWSAINVPVGGSLTLQFLGRMSASDSAPTLIDQRKLELYGDIIMIERPYRLTPLQ